jgi:murein DD-endopeptidase MepM/ murein hydrolase activator NlpD
MKNSGGALQMVNWPKLATLSKFFAKVWLFVLIVTSVPQGVQAGFVRPLVFPVNGPHHFQDDFSDPRSGGAREHLGNDIIADKLTPVMAAVDGHVSYLVSPQAAWGYAIVLKDAEGYEYWYLHLNNDTPGTDDGLGGEVNAYAPGIARGVSVVKGQLLGWVGDSGNAESTVAHLHFELRLPDGGAINPYESLLAATPPPALVSTTQGGVIKNIITIPSDYRVIKYATEPSIYLLINKIKYKIADGSTFASLGLSWSEVKTIPASEQYLSGPTLEAGPTLVVQRSGPVGTSGYVFTQNLTVGSKGEEVKQLQLKLKALGYFTYPTITSYYGTVTRDAVIRFQKAKGIEPVGYVGPKTRAALNSV